MKTRIEAPLPTAASRLDEDYRTPGGDAAERSGTPTARPVDRSDEPRRLAEKETELVVCPDCYAGLRVAETQSEVRCGGCGTLLELLDAVESAPHADATPGPETDAASSAEEVRDLFASLLDATRNGWWQPPQELRNPPEIPGETPLLAAWRALGPARDAAALLAQAGSVAASAAVREVLVVDDAPEVCALLAAAAERAGEGRVHVTSESDSVRALDRVRAQAYDVVISDIDMPGATGLDVMEAAYERNPEGHRIVVTGSDRMGIGDRIRAGVPLDAFLHKSLPASRITAAVTACLSTSWAAPSEGAKV